MTDKTDDNRPSTLPLSALRVAEFTHTVMGPTCGVFLADLGADVVRVEPPPDGDRTRYLTGTGTGYFGFYNRNKKSVMLDLKSAEGIEAAKRLVASADILIENFGPGTMDRLGLGYEALSADNPQLIYCSLKGFLPGPYEKRQALDEVVQMMSGLAYMTGPPGRPLRAGASVIDVMGGMSGVIGILSAVEERHRTGKGQLVQGSLYESAVFLMGQHMVQSVVTGQELQPMSVRDSAWAIYQPFDTADEGRQVFVGLTTDNIWNRFCKAFDRDDLLADPDLQTNIDRCRHRQRLIDDIGTQFKAIGADDLMARCEAAGIPFAPVRKPGELFDDPHLVEAGLLWDSTLPGGQETRLPGLPVGMSDHKFGLYADPAAPGEDTRSVFLDLGYDAGQIDALLAQGAMGEAKKKG
ncbi:CaiB/BaiF CoA-transferase family protein [Fodinicurvata sp. EGI_FJ10296]|uniref:CaiB/BaiF CoA transferase family protein n=1 Tax=Fodinicurvata sp. EGI_FJ10296 TaxID=3231908 RepID=UPI003455F40B